MRQYYRTALADALIVPASPVSGATSATAIFSINQANKYMPLPYGQNAPSPGQIFRVACGGLITTASSGTLIIIAYHGPGSSTTSFGTTLATSNTMTPTASLSSGYWNLEGVLIYRAISETSTTSTAWFNGTFIVGGPSGGANAVVTAIMSSGAAISVDTTGLGSNLYGCLQFSATFSSTTGTPTITPEYAYVEAVN